MLAFHSPYRAIFYIHWILLSTATVSLAQWEMPILRSESPFARQEANAAGTTLPLQLGGAPVSKELAAGRDATFMFMISANTALFRVTVSPCMAAEGIQWDVSHQGTMLFQHRSQGGSIGKRNVSADAYNVPMYSGYGARNRGKRQIPLPGAFSHPAERKSPVAFPGPGYDLPARTATYTSKNTDPGEYHVTVRNTGHQQSHFTIQLSAGPPGDAPILPQESALAVRSVRHNQVTLEWQPTLATQAVEYCLQYIIASQVEKNDVLNSECGIERVNARKSHPSSIGSRTPQQCTRMTQLNVANLFPDTGYVMNIIARDIRSGKKVVYRGVWVKTLNKGAAIQDGQELANYTLFPRSKQIFTFDLAGHVTQDNLITMKQSGQRLRVSVVPCSGRVTWDVTKDGIPNQYFSPHYINLDDTDDSSSDSEEEEKSDNTAVQNSLTEQQSHVGVLGATERRKRDSDLLFQPANRHQFEEDGDFYADNLEGPRRNVLRPPPPRDAGLGKSTGRTSYTYIDAPDRADNTYQITVYNTQYSDEASFNIRAELLNRIPRPQLPIDPQIRVLNVNSGKVQLNFLESKGSRRGSDPQYCAVATPKSQLKPLAVMSSACGVQRKIPSGLLKSLNPGAPHSNSPFGRGRSRAIGGGLPGNPGIEPVQNGVPASPFADIPAPNNNPAPKLPAADNNPFISRPRTRTVPLAPPPPPDNFFSPKEADVRPNPFDTAPAPKSGSPFANPAEELPTINPGVPMLQSTLRVQSMRVTCGRSTQPILDNLEPGTEYAIEVVALEPDSLELMSPYTSALIRTEPSQPSSALQRSEFALPFSALTLFSLFIMSML